MPLKDARPDDMRSGAPMSLADGIQDFFSHADPEGTKARNAAKYLDAYRRAVILRTWRNSPEAAKLILDHTNAFYVRKDDTPRKGPDKDVPRIVCEICTDDSIVRSEIDLKREMLQLDLAYEGLHFDELRIKPAKFGMKSRHPFHMTLDDIASFKSEHRSASNAPSVTKKIDDLQTVKRAFCVAIGPDAYAVLDKICAAYIEVIPLNQKTNMRFHNTQRHWLYLYTEDPRLSEIVSSYEPAIKQAARKLGLVIGKIHVRAATPEMYGCRAFPSCGKPRIIAEAKGGQGRRVIAAESHGSNDRLARVEPSE